MTAAIYSSPHITAKPVSQYTEEGKLKSWSSVTLRQITLTLLFSAFLGIVFLRHR